MKGGKKKGGNNIANANPSQAEKLKVMLLPKIN